MLKYSKLSEYKIKKISRCFLDDLTATQTSELLGISRNTINRYYKVFRELIADFCELEFNANFTQEYCDHVHKRILNQPIEKVSSNEIPAIVLLNKAGKIYTRIIPNAEAKLIVEKMNKSKEANLNDNTYFEYLYGGVVLNGTKYYKLSTKDSLIQDKYNVSLVESFWSHCKRRLAKFNGIKSQDYYLHIKECEFRFNHRKDDIFELLLMLIRQF